MLRYAALGNLLVSISFFALHANANANIGCLFSETLCNPEKEWCFDDSAFGRCLTLYGNVRDEDLHRYNFGVADLHVLEREMERLFLLGYRWSHSYTQCVMQSILKSVRTKSSVDVGHCKMDLEHDLEGALEATEKEEEVEEGDPQNLAVVRFVPSDANPHSAYADEFYYPPAEEELPPYRPNVQQKEEKEKIKEKAKENSGSENKSKENISDHSVHDKNNKQNEHSKNEQASSTVTTPKSIPSPAIHPASNDDHYTPHIEPFRGDDSDDYFFPYTDDMPYYDEKSKDDEVIVPGSYGQDRIQLNPAVMPMYMYYDDDDDDPKMPIISEKDYNYDLVFHSPYASRPRISQFYKRNGGIQMKRSGYGTDTKARRYRNPLPLSYKARDLRELAHMLSDISPKEKNSNKGSPIEHSPINDVYQPRPRGETHPMRDSDSGITHYHENPVGPVFDRPSAEDQVIGEMSFYSPYELLPPRQFPKPPTQIPELKPPLRDDNASPDTLHPPYVESDYDKHDLRMEHPKQHFRNSANRFDFQPNQPAYELAPRYGPHDAHWMMADDSRPQQGYQNSPDARQGYPNSPDGKLGPRNAYGGLQGGSLPPHIPADSFYRRLPHQPYYQQQQYDYPDYGATYYDYGGDYVDLAMPPAWKFQRDERPDVKKPGPLFKSANAFAFDYSQGNDNVDYPGAIEGDWPQQDTSGSMAEENLLLSKMRQNQGFGKDGKPKHNILAETTQDKIPDLLLTDEGFVEAASDEAHRNSNPGFPKAEPRVSHNDGNTGLRSGPPRARQADTYVYIKINGNFPSDHIAKQMILLILNMSKLEMRHIQRISVNGNEVRFQLRKNEAGMTAAHLAERTEELRGSVKDKTGIEIIQAGVGNKDGMLAVVYSSGERQMLAVAAIVCGVCAALVVAATALFFLRRHSKTKAKLKGIATHHSEASKDYQDLCRARMAGKGDGKDTALSGPPGQAQPVGSATAATKGERLTNFAKDPDNGNNPPSSRSSTSSWSDEPVISNMDISTGHMVLSYMEDHLRNKDRLEQEWIALCAYEAEPCACYFAMKPDNVKKNRYPDILPYDHNRVMLNEHKNFSKSSYINASSITDHDPRNPAYISTQGPLAGTAADFWQLVWEQGSVVIVMLTRLTENGQTLCHRYWPEEGSELYHIYEVHLVSEHIWCDDYLVRSFFLKNIRTSETRTVTQFHFLSWPESGIPASTKALLEFRRKVNKSYRGRSCPIIVHCSDGVGRSGTYCLIDMVLNRMAKGTKEIDIAATLEHIRDQRPNMVRTKVQFEFVLMSVAEEVHAILKALPQ